MTEKRLVLAVYTDNNIYEYFLPGQNNRKIKVDIPAAATGCPFDIGLSLEVWNGVWQLNGTDEMSLAVGQAGQKNVVLQEGLIVSCQHKKTGFAYTIVIENNYEGYSDFDKYVFTGGTASIGRDAGNTIEYSVLSGGGDQLVSGRHATLAAGADGSYTVTDESTNGTFVNGERITGSRKLSFGDVVYIIGMKIVCLHGLLAINRPINAVTVRELDLFAPAPEESGQGAPVAADEYYQRSPRQVEDFDNEAIEIEAPPNPAKSRRQPLIFTVGPAMTMLIPMATGALFTVWNARQTDGNAGAFMFMGIITSLTAAVIGIFWALANNRYNVRTEREAEELRSRLYRAYLLRIRELLAQKHAGNKAMLDKKYPASSECLGYVRNKNRRLWERNVNHRDFLTVRLGRGDMPAPNEIGVPKERFSLVDDALVEEPQSIRRDYSRLRDVPICLSLQEHSLVGVIGDSPAACVRAAQLMAAGVAAHHAYTDVRMAFIYNKKDAQYFDFARWLPHVWNVDGSLRMMACDENGVGEVFYDLSAVLRERLEGRENRDDKARPLPRYVVFIAAPSLVAGEALMKYLSAPTAPMGFTVVMAYGQISRLPNNCTVIVQNDGEYQGYYSLDSSFEAYKNVAFDTIEDNMLTEFAREMSGVRVRETHASGAPPQLLTFLDMYKTSTVDGLDVERRWLENRTYESMKAMIGYRGPDTPLYLDIHEKYHGPHGLVAGTTGAGKSEMLQAYIL
ncbi:MAG: FHA domain-containing protein, partial [Lachnospiraceae bacterium]|nr:FHA domain-containing protein [Lachnospiraceae bacterium]